MLDNFARTYKSRLHTKVESKSRRKEWRKARAREIHRRLLIYGDLLNIFRRYVGYPRIYTIPRQLLTLRMARYFIVHRSSQKKRKVANPSEFFSLLFCNPSLDIREISVGNLVVLIISKRKERGGERERERERESIKGIISSFDTFNLVAAVS